METTGGIYNYVSFICLTYRLLQNYYLLIWLGSQCKDDEYKMRKRNEEFNPRKEKIQC